MEGVRPFGRAYFDSTRQAHEVYGVDPARGGIVVFRPDGWIGTVVKMDDYEKLGDYFAEFLREKSGAAVKGVNGSA
jgi:phenol 2-monooxygenase